jgi:serine O-acetyltransferase
MSNSSERCASYGHRQFKSLLASIRSDIRRFQTKSPENLAAPDDLVHRASAFLTPEILAQTIYRIAHFFYVRGWIRIAALMARLNSYTHKINIPPQSCIGPGLHIPHPCGITFCGSAGEDLTLYSLATCGATSDYADGPLEQSPVLGDRIISGAHQAIMGPVRIGDDVILGVGCSKISEDVPSAVLVYPRQARVFIPKPVAIEDFRRNLGDNQ